VACHISLKSPRWGPQLWFTPHLNQRFAKKIMSLQSCDNPNFKNFETPNLGVLGQNDIWMWPPWLITDNSIRGKVVPSPSLSRDESCEFVYACGLFVHKKRSIYALTNLFFGSCRFVWTIDMLIIHRSPHLETPACPSMPPSVANEGMCPKFLISLFSPLDLHLSLSRSLRVF